MRRKATAASSGAGDFDAVVFIFRIFLFDYWFGERSVERIFNKSLFHSLFRGNSQSDSLPPVQKIIHLTSTDLEILFS